MIANVFPPASLKALASAYPARPAMFSHSLIDHPLLTLAALEGLAQRLPADSIEYNPGALPIGIAPEAIPPAERGVIETIRTIDQCGSWMVLKRIEQHPDYAALLHAILDQIKPITDRNTGQMHRCEGFIFISSPGSVTPFHFDPEHNLLLQLRGRKTMTVFSAEDQDLLDSTVHEAFHLGQHHRNLIWLDEFADRGTAITIAPGEAIHVPVKAPHWVQNLDEVSLSLSVTWRSDWSVAEADARAFNHVIRQFGLKPRAPAPFPARNLAKSLAYRAIRRTRGRSQTQTDAGT